jgi:hyperosmotically inducible protein
VFRVLLTLLLLIGIVLGALYLYEGGEIPYVGGTLDDARTTASVKALLALHRDLSRRDISVRTRDSVVTLTGEVKTAGEKKEAAEIVRGIGGVREVDNLLAVSRAD